MVDFAELVLPPKLNGDAVVDDDVAPNGLLAVLLLPNGVVFAAAPPPNGLAD